MTWKEYHEDYLNSLVEYFDRFYKPQKAVSFAKPSAVKAAGSYWIQSERITLSMPNSSSSNLVRSRRERLFTDAEQNIEPYDPDYRFRYGYDSTEVDMSGLDVSDDDWADYYEWQRGR